MTIIVTTKSGSIYRFAEMGGRTYVNDGNLAGEVIRIQNGPICVGKSIKMVVRKKGFNANSDKGVARPVSTTPVKNISVSL